MARALALLNGRQFVIPDDLQAIAIPCLAHRLVVDSSSEAQQVIRELLTQIDVV